LRQWALSLAPEQPPVTTCAATGSKSTGVYNSWTGPVTSFKICQTCWNLVKPGETWWNLEPPKESAKAGTARMPP
jgi:hypothetical protein